MSSPYRPSSSSSSSASMDRRRRTESQQPNGIHKFSRTNRDSTSSPSRQFLEEFSRIYIAETQSLKRNLDAQADAQEKLHHEALARSLAEHEAVRKSAERARERVEIEIERERRRRREEEKVKLDEAKDRAEREQREQRLREVERLRLREEEQRIREAEDRHREEARRNEEARRKQEQDDRLRREKENQEREEKDRQAKQEAARRAEAQSRLEKLAVPTPPSVEQNPPTTTTASVPTSISANGPTAEPKNIPSLPILTPRGISSTQREREVEHQRYLDMHKRLKDMRKWVLQEASKHKGLKNQLSEMRRTIKKSLSIVNAVDKTLNKKPTADIRNLLDTAAQMTNFTIDPTPFIIALDQQPSPGGSTQYPAALLFLLNYFAKYVLQRFTDQVGRDPKSAEPYGILVVTIFAAPPFHYNNHSLIDVLWAKYHKICPVLFGLNGDEKTVKGRHRLGWKFEKDTAGPDPSKGSFVPTDEHLGNQTGLATGFAAITLRDFSKSRNTNPAPNRLYWTSLARILSTPPAERTGTHYVVIRNLVEHYVPRFIVFYGQAAIAVLRRIFKDLPREATNKLDPNVLALEGMLMFLEKDHDLVL